MSIRTGLLLTGLVGLCPALALAAAPVSDLKADARNGQVFLTWKEADSPHAATFNVYVADRPISDVAKAHRIGHHIERHSARDWWEDPASFGKDRAPGKPVGFLIQSGKPRLDPADGLFVHTVKQDAPAQLFFAVTCSDAKGKEDAEVAVGANSLRDGLRCVPGQVQPIWQRTSRQPAPGAGRGKGAWLNLHAKGGVVPDMEYLVFGDERMGWREGLPFKFSVRIQDDAILVRPTDRVWINRPLVEAGDSGTRAIWTFWYGYNSHIFNRSLMQSGVPTNYTERRNLWILNWVQSYYQPDPHRWHCSGSSMGGCGTVSFGLRHPEWFAALHAHVPIVSYTYLGRSSAHRLEPTCWIGPIDGRLRTDEGTPLLDRMNGARLVKETKGDLPPLFVIVGRRDASIPWENNPPFFQAMSDSRQALTAYWDNGEHGTCGKDAPADVRGWTQRLRRFRLDESYPAFTHTSSNRNPGDGRPDNGDIIGWINRGMDWKDIEDTPDHYSITVLADYPGIEYPVQTDVTLRRLQKFKIRPAEQLSVRVGDAPPARVAADANGLATIPGVKIPSKAGVRVHLERRGGAAQGTP